MTEFPDPRYEHDLPEDDFKHDKSMDCACKPFREWTREKGTRVKHKPIVAGKFEDTFPEEWAERKR